MNENGRSCIRRIFKSFAAFLILATLQPAHAQLFDDTFIERVRATSQMIPGHLPLELRFQVFAHYSGPMSSWVQDGSSAVVPGVIGVFQIRFPDSWIMVDAGAEKEMIQWEVEFSEEDYELVGQALRGANMIVATHEHADHIAGLVRGTWAADAARRALLTSEQLEALVIGPDHPGIQISRSRAEQFLSVKYDRLLPISPGVVLIKAPGHSAGSQIIFVNLDDGTELLLVGDVVWVTTALESGSQRPLALSARLGEDRDALASQIQWLQQMRQDGLRVVVAHDAPALDALIDMGVIKSGVYLAESD
ncbi:MAG: glyoxylase-like metal-dependent hydrolase (beta-lactamase superfamily II) [Woeseiaceae bacterium]|jgi:glyoxylase-like metal-dependent hydrolase (beta-lactamase superfamily II)